MPVRRTIGVDMGWSRLRAGAIDADLSVHRRAQRSVVGLDRARQVAVVVDAVQEVGELAGVEPVAVGLALPRGDTDPVLADAVAERVGLPVSAGGPGELAALAEHRAGAARGAGAAVVLTITDEVRGAVIAAGELGGELDLVRAQADARVSELAHDGDPDAQRALLALADQLATLLVALDPERAVIGAGAPLLDAVRLEMTRRGAGALPIVPAWFGAEATMVGAGAHALDALAEGRR